MRLQTVNHGDYKAFEVRIQEIGLFLIFIELADLEKSEFALDNAYALYLRAAVA